MQEYVHVGLYWLLVTGGMFAVAWKWPTGSGHAGDTTTMLLCLMAICGAIGSLAGPLLLLILLKLVEHWK